MTPAFDDQSWRRWGDAGWVGRRQQVGVVEDADDTPDGRLDLVG